MAFALRLRRKISSLLAYLFQPPTLEQNYLQRTDSFLSDMRAQTNPKDLYRWAKDQIRQAAGQRMALSYFPGFLGWTASRMPNDGYVESLDGTTYVHVIWNKGGNRWGLKVGPPAFEPNADSEDHHVQWAPGIYAWHEIKNKPAPGN